MANGAMLAELKRMAETSDISLKDSQRLMLCALAEMYSTINEHILVDQGVQECMREISGKVDNLTDEMALLKKQVNDTNDNPLVSFGKHIKEHPRMAVLYVLIVMILTTWLPYFNLVRMLLIWVGVPMGIVDIITPSIGGQ